MESGNSREEQAEIALMNHDFKIKANKKDGFYTVSVCEKDGKLTISCDCTAGIYGKNCSHKTAILSGDLGVIKQFSPEDIAAYDRLIELLAGSEIEKLSLYFTELKHRKENIDKEIKKVRHRLERAMKKGFDISF